MTRQSTVPAVILILTAITLAGCVSAADRINPSWTPEMFFKNAQEAMDAQKYKEALFYYDVFLVRYPEDRQKAIAAEYEKAYIKYKTGNLKAAEAGFREVMEMYEKSPYAVLYHPRFKTLCEISLKNIERHKAVTGRLFWRSREKKWAEENGENLLDTGDDGG